MDFFYSMYHGHTGWGVGTGGHRWAQGGTGACTPMVYTHISQNLSNLQVLIFLFQVVCETERQHEPSLLLLKIDGFSL